MKTREQKLEEALKRMVKLGERDPSYELYVGIAKEALKLEFNPTIGKLYAYYGDNTYDSCFFV